MQLHILVSHSILLSSFLCHFPTNYGGLNVQVERLSFSPRIHLSSTPFSPFRPNAQQLPLRLPCQQSQRGTTSTTTSLSAARQCRSRIQKPPPLPLSLFSILHNTTHANHPLTRVRFPSFSPLSSQRILPGQGGHRSHKKHTVRRPLSGLLRGVYDLCYPVGTQDKLGMLPGCERLPVSRESGSLLLFDLIGNSCSGLFAG